MCTVVFLCFEAQHFNQAWLVQYRIGIGRAHQRGNAPRSGRGTFAAELAGLGLAGFAQARAQVHQTRCDHEALCGNRLVGDKTRGCVANREDVAIGNGQVPVVAALAWRVLSEGVRFRGMRVGLPKGEAVASEGRKYNDELCGGGHEGGSNAR